MPFGMFWTYPALLVVLLVVGVWAWQERQETDSAKETTQRVGNRAKRATGGVFGVLGATLLALFGTAWQAGMEVQEVVIYIIDLAAANPEVSSGLGVAVLGKLAIDGNIALSGTRFIGIALLLLGLGLVFAARRNGGPA